ncbi:hypothetical protein LF63_0108005 [Oleiagrimonas soli]|uniref:Uncharacterized protein n=1 Tax=Oleiagrimonas soli TaxID=1543381 RepID=A0A099CX97_9GAMM|nr:hypothetical protein LF63_0108005 [Oleiagrimonas soli]
MTRLLGHMHRNTALFEDAVYQTAAAGRVVEQYHGFAMQFLPGHAIQSSQRMIVPADQHEWIVQDDLLVELAIVRRVDGDTEVDFTAAYAVEHLSLRLVAQVQCQLGIVPSAFRDAARHQRGRWCRCRRHAHGAAPTFAFRPNMGKHVFQFVQHTLHGAVQVAAGFGRDDFARASIEQAYAQLGFQIGDVTADGWLREMQLLGGTPEMAEAGDGEEDTQLAQTHIHKNILSLITI